MASPHPPRRPSSQVDRFTGKHSVFPRLDPPSCLSVLARKQHWLRLPRIVSSFQLNHSPLLYGHLLQQLLGTPSARAFAHHLGPLALHFTCTKTVNTTLSNMTSLQHTTTLQFTHHKDGWAKGHFRGGRVDLQSNTLHGQMTPAALFAALPSLRSPVDPCGTVLSLLHLVTKEGMRSWRWWTGMDRVSHLWSPGRFLPPKS